jgi:hypothetical protein
MPPRIKMLFLLYTQWCWENWVNLVNKLNYFDPIIFLNNYPPQMLRDLDLEWHPFKQMLGTYNLFSSRKYETVVVIPDKNYQ